MGLRDQSIVGCFPELCFSVFHGAVFPTHACGSAFNNNNNNNNNNNIP